MQLEFRVFSCQFTYDVTRKFTSPTGYYEILLIFHRYGRVSKKEEVESYRKIISQMISSLVGLVTALVTQWQKDLRKKLILLLWGWFLVQQNLSSGAPSTVHSIQDCSSYLTWCWTNKVREHENCLLTGLGVQRLSWNLAPWIFSNLPALVSDNTKMAISDACFIISQRWLGANHWRAHM